MAQILHFQRRIACEVHVTSQTTREALKNALESIGHTVTMQGNTLYATPQTKKPSKNNGLGLLGRFKRGKSASRCTITQTEGAKPAVLLHLHQEV